MLCWDSGEGMHAYFWRSRRMMAVFVCGFCVCNVMVVCASWSAVSNLRHKITWHRQTHKNHTQQQQQQQQFFFQFCLVGCCLCCLAFFYYNVFVSFVFEWSVTKAKYSQLDCSCLPMILASCLDLATVHILSPREVRLLMHMLTSAFRVWNEDRKDPVSMSQWKCLSDQTPSLLLSTIHIGDSCAWQFLSPSKAQNTTSTPTLRSDQPDAHKKWERKQESFFIFIILHTTYSVSFWEEPSVTPWVPTWRDSVWGKSVHHHPHSYNPLSGPCAWRQLFHNTWAEYFTGDFVFF